MNYGAFSRWEMRAVFWEVVLAIFFAGVIFAALLITTGGVLVSLITASMAMIFFGLLHYWIWGQALMKSVERERAPQALERPRPADEFTIAVNEHERGELIDVLEQALAQTSEERHLARPANGREAGRKRTIREVLERIRGFGA